MSRFRLLNGYRLVYVPGHPHAMSSENWDGFVYEHILVATEILGRTLEDNEVVHHLDLDKANNLPSNLIVLDRGQHTKLHAWLLAGAQTVESEVANPSVDSGVPYCCCGTPLVRGQETFCSRKCAFRASQPVRPSKEQVLEDLTRMTQSAAARKYGVSGTTVRKWIRRWGISSVLTLRTSGG